MYGMLENKLYDIEAREWYERRGAREMYWTWGLALTDVVIGDEWREAISQQ